MNCFWISLFLERLRCRYTMVDCISTWPRRFLISVIEAPLRSICTAQEWTEAVDGIEFTHTLSRKGTGEILFTESIDTMPCK
ncbi:MAG: hypothetical protein ACMUIU_15685, partial [bacterium]